MVFNPLKLKAARHLKGYSSKELARLINLDINAYWRLENGKTQIKMNTLLQVAEVLEQPLKYFVDDSTVSAVIKNKLNELSILLERLQGDEKILYQTLYSQLTNTLKNEIE